MINEIQFKQGNDKTAPRTLMFLRAIALDPGILAALMAGGYTQADQDYAWGKLLNIGGYHVKFGPAGGSAAGEAMVALDEEDEALLERSEAVMRRYHPAQADFVFAGLTAGKGADSVIAVGTFLTRLDALESDPSREATGVVDHAALAKLGERGITKAERTRLAGLVKTAQSVAGSAKPVEATEEQRAKDIEALRSWYEDWSQTARALIKRRDYLVRLGLSKRKTRKKEEVEPVAPTQPIPFFTPPAPPAPVPAPTGGNGAPSPFVTPIG